MRVTEAWSMDLFGMPLDEEPDVALAPDVQAHDFADLPDRHHGWDCNALTVCLLGFQRPAW